MCNLEGFNMNTQAAEELSGHPNAKEYTPGIQIARCSEWNFILLTTETNLEGKTPTKSDML